MKKIKISAVSYLNTIPFIYGIEQKKHSLGNIELYKDIPSECSRKLINDEVDLGLIPIASLHDLDYYTIISDYCIGSIGKVHSVLLVSDVPLEQIQSIYLDYQSRTSVKLCQVLCKKFWNINPKFLPSDNGYENRINKSTAGVIIGDRTFSLPRKYKYIYDLSHEWMKWQKLPFVFACWASNKKLDDNFIENFNQALEFGLNNIEDSLKLYKQNTLTAEKQKEYIRKYISYTLDKQKKKSLSIFLEEIKSL